MSKRRWLLFAIAGAVVVAAIPASVLLPAPAGMTGEPTGTSPVSPPGAKVPTPVTVAEVVSRPIQRAVSVVGSLHGWEELSVSAKVEGRVTTVRHDVGDEVKPGEILIELDPTDAELSVFEAERGLELELTKLGLTDSPLASFDLASLPSVARAKARAQHTETKLRRLKNSGIAGSADEVAQAEYDARDAEEARRQAQLDAATTLAAVRQRQATVATARQRLADTRITVPKLPTATGEAAAYLVAERSVSEGEIVRASSSGLVRLVLADTLKLKSAVPERYLGEVKAGQQVLLSVEAYPSERFPGQVTRVNPTVDRSSRTFQIECAVPNKSRRLAAGGFAKAEVRTRLDSDTVVVPEHALVSFAGVTKVFVIRDGKATAVPVRAKDVRVDGSGSGQGQALVEVSGAVKAGDRVAVSGLSKITDGGAVRGRDESAKGEQR